MFMVVRSPPNPAVGPTVKRLREARSMTQEDVAFAARLNVSGLSKLERGKVDPLWGTVERIAKTFGMSVSELAQAIEDTAA